MLTSPRIPMATMATITVNMSTITMKAMITTTMKKWSTRMMMHQGRKKVGVAEFVVRT